MVHTIVFGRVALVASQLSRQPSAVERGFHLPIPREARDRRLTILTLIVRSDLAPGRFDQVLDANRPWGLVGGLNSRLT